VVSHDIPLINKNQRIRHRPSKCPEPLLLKLKEKVDCYLKAGLWKRTNLPSSALMMIVIKKSSAIRTVIDTRQHNENMLADDTPMPDQEMSRNTYVRAHFRMKIDLSDAYEQVCVNLEHIPRTVFETPFGNMLSKVIQQGDKNGPIFPKTNEYCPCGGDSSLCILLSRQYICLFRHMART
jgi:hypothetical protein